VDDLQLSLYLLILEDTSTQAQHSRLTWVSFKELGAEEAGGTIAGRAFSGSFWPTTVAEVGGFMLRSHRCSKVRRTLPSLVAKRSLFRHNLETLESKSFVGNIGIPPVKIQIPFLAVGEPYIPRPVKNVPSRVDFAGKCPRNERGRVNRL
jgi:hypothetical protein